MLGLHLDHLPLLMMAIVWLVFLEGLLSGDNALVLAMMVRHLPKAQQKRALRYGIWGAIAFRVLAVGLAKLLLDFWILKVVGGLYLVYLAVAHFFSRPHDDSDGAANRGFAKSFWGTVISVELADIAFSIDSILTAVATADGLPADRFGQNEKLMVVLTGGILGIITMRFVAGYFILLLERFRGLEPGAYGLVAWIGLKLVGGGLHRGHILPFELNEWVFWVGMAVILGMGFLYKPNTPPTPEDTVELVHRMTGIIPDSDDDAESDSDTGHGSPGQPPAELPASPG